MVGATGAQGGGLVRAILLEQARIAASLGDAARTVRFLEAAFEQGGQDFFGLHFDPRYGAIRDDPAFVAYMRPKG